MLWVLTHPAPISQGVVRICPRQAPLHRQRLLVEGDQAWIQDIGLGDGGGVGVDASQLVFNFVITGIAAI